VLPRLQADWRKTSLWSLFVSVGRLLQMQDIGVELADAIEKHNLPMDQLAVLNNKMNKLLLVLRFDKNQV
jgi:hypothetical protein